MTELDTLIEKAYADEGATEAVNKVYTVLFRSQLFMPAFEQDDEEEPFSPLYMEDKGNYYIPVFDTLERLQTWAADEFDSLDYVEIVGADVVRCVGDEHVYVCLNPGTQFYKEFSPEEIVRLKAMIAKIDQLKDAGNARNFDEEK